ncbi:LPD1 domain-containing protein [Oceanobacillus luteolus]|uniref:LPD1 domain-containing protein n=1 Tax=Oceanobacillus luteolus TaxID=1274358 RepID=A0ABW4HYA5_9BACI
MGAQMNLFDIELVNNKGKTKDIRSEAQANRKVAYDVGEKVGGSRKDEAALRKAFEESHTENNLKELESLSAVTAAEMITKTELFKHFSLEDEKERGTEPVVARIKQLLIQRIDKIPANDSAESRQQFLRAANFIQFELEYIFTLDELVEWVYEIRSHMRYEKLDPSYVKNRIGYAEHILKSNSDEEEKAKAKKDLRAYKKQLKNIEIASKTPLRVLGKSFTNFFINASSANATINNVEKKVKSWEDLLSPKKAIKKRTANKPVWEREFPERPDRYGGRVSMIRTGEQLMNEFNFRGVEFGNWTNDEIGANHIFRSSEAFYDLIDILRLKHKESVSLDGSLAMAYGSRGRGSALGHYEPARKVINLTRNRGSLGIMAHEWFHALDNYLYDVSHSYQNGLTGYLSDWSGAGNSISPLIIDTFQGLMKAIKEGTSLRLIDNTNKPNDRWRIGSSLANLYKEKDSLSEVIVELKIQSNEQLERKLTYSLPSFLNAKDYEKIKQNEINKNEREFVKKIQALAWLHEQETGERLEKIPVPTDRTQFYNNAIELDRNKEGKYWSSNVELAARAFEAYIEDLLKDNDMKNDYLVCGTNDSKAFPIGEERKKINTYFDILFIHLRQNNLA